jgi:hypothetical protein
MNFKLLHAVTWFLVKTGERGVAAVQAAAVAVTAVTMMKQLNIINDDCTVCFI